MTPADPNLAYLYSRVSGNVQVKGSGLARQQEGHEWAAEKGWRIDYLITFDDLGLSAFRGKNYKIGALARFLEMAEAGELPGRILVIDEFSRMSRTAIIEANKLFTRLLETGFTIAFTMDRTTYTKKEINEGDGGKWIMAQLKMQAAHDYSRSLRRNVGKAWKAKREARATGNARPTNDCPMWLLAVDKAAYEAGLIRPRADKYAQTIYIERVVQGEPIGRFEVVRLIFQLAITGLGKRAIAKRLNDRCIPAFRGRNGWHHSSVQRILQNPAVIGHYQAYTRDIDDEGVRHYEKAGAVIENHFPVVIEPDTYWTAQGAIQGRSKNAAGRHGASNANVLRGLCKCLVCGSGLTYINKGRLGGQFLLCTGAQQGRCTAGYHHPYLAIESELLRFIPTLDFGRVMPEPTLVDPAIAIEGEIATATRKLARLAKVIGDDDAGDDDPIIVEMRDLRATLKGLRATLAQTNHQARIDEQVNHRHRVDRLVDLIIRMDMGTPEERADVRASIAMEMRRLIDRIDVQGDKVMVVRMKPLAGLVTTLRLVGQRIVETTETDDAGVVVKDRVAAEIAAMIGEAA